MVPTVFRNTSKSEKCVGGGSQADVLTAEPEHAKLVREIMTKARVSRKDARACRTRNDPQRSSGCSLLTLLE